MKIFAAMLAVFCAAGIGMGKMLFTDTGFALVTGLCSNSRPLHIP